ncbi:MAG: RNA 2',3'-cyclic phosphodiesterase [bacterium]|nr:MAG: RNA 2',3'-cyclic phosphodiesterase [bacterium]
MIHYPLMETARSFVAVKLDEELRGSMQRVTERLKSAGPYVRWVKPENLHITLKFLGNVETARMGDVEESLQKCVRDCSSFELQFKGIDVIPNPRYPRVVYAGIEEGVEPLKKLTHCVEDGMSALGFVREERDFLPHLTIGRVKSFKAKSMLVMKIREFHKKEIGRLLVYSIFLMKSELHRDGAIYTELAEMPLVKGGKNE